MTAPEPKCSKIPALTNITSIWVAKINSTIGSIFIMESIYINI